MRDRPYDPLEDQRFIWYRGNRCNHSRDGLRRHALRSRAISYSERDLGRRHARVFNARGDTLQSAVERKRVGNPTGAAFVSDSSRT